MRIQCAGWSIATTTNCGTSRSVSISNCAGGVGGGNGGGGGGGGGGGAPGGPGGPGGRPGGVKVKRGDAEIEA